MIPEGRVHDVRFHRYDGPRSGRFAALWSMTRWSALRALGAKRGWKAKVIPIALTLVAFFPALIVLGLRALFPATINDNLAAVLPYSDYAGIVGLVILVFAVVVTPELLCPDRRDGTLALYFATAISRTDYVLGKVSAALLPLLLVTVLPPAILYAGNVLFATHPFGYVQDHLHDIPRIAAAGIAMALYFAFVGLAISSLTGRRAFAVGGYLAFLIVPTIVGGILSNNIEHGENFRLMAFAAVPIHTAEALYPVSPDPGDPSNSAWVLVWLVLIALSALVLAWRFRGTRDERPAGDRVRGRLALVRRHRRCRRRDVLGRAGRHGPARPQRRRQVDHPQAVRRVHLAERGGGAHLRRRAAPQPGRLRADRRRSRPEPAVAVPDSARGRPPVRAPAQGRRSRMPRGPGALETVGLDRRRGAQGGRLLARHAPACEAGPGARPRSRPAAARRAAQRPRPGAAARDHRRAAPAGRRGAHGDRVVTRPARGRADGAAGARARERPPGRRGPDERASAS